MGSMLLREIVDGNHVSRRVKLRPTLYVNAVEGYETDLKTVHGVPVSSIDFDTVGEARRFIDTYDGVDGFDVYGSSSWEYVAVDEMYPGEVDYDPKQVCVAYLDIETRVGPGKIRPDLAREEVTSIAFSVAGKMHVFSCVEYDASSGTVDYKKCSDEEDLLTSFLEKWSHYPIDVLVGWNIDFFDLPYIINRVNRVLGPDASKALSPWGILRSREGYDGNGNAQVMWTVVGITVVDYMQAYKKFTHKTQESYSLNYICHAELKEKKLDYSEYASLNELYKNDPQKFIDYNVRDVTLMERLDAKLGLLDLIYTISYYCKINYADAFGTVKMWECLIHNELKSDGVVVPRKKSAVKASFEGGFVKEVQKGRHDWVASFDFDSLYPHLIMALNISPETISGTVPRLSVDEILDGRLDEYRDIIGDRCVAGSCHLYSREKQGFFPKIMEKLYSERKSNRKKSGEYKKKYASSADPVEKSKLDVMKTRYHNLQLAQKYMLNSGYGAMSNEHFLWFDMRMAESVTLSGQVAIQWVGRRVDEYVRKQTKSERDTVVAIDTDSLYVRFSELVDAVGLGGAEPKRVAEFLDEVCSEKIGPLIRAACDEWDSYVNAFPRKLNMKREKISQSAMWTAKKAYAQLVWVDEEVKFTEPELKFTGLAIVRSSTPAICKDKMRETIRLMFTGTERKLQEYVREFKTEFDAARFEEVAAISGVNGIDTYGDGSGGYTKGTTMQAKAAITYNRVLEEKGLTSKYPVIVDGDRVKYSAMKLPNPFGEEVIGCSTVMPTEFGAEPYIDRDKQFYKVFVQPMKLLLDTIGWSHERKPTMAGFF